MLQNQVCLFFYVNGRFLIHGCTLDEAEEYGDFLIYPGGHFDIWDKEYANRYHVDYDYFPRGRVAYNRVKQEFQILFDRCIADKMPQFAEERYTTAYTLGLDAHYRCHRCNRGYIR